MYCRSGIRSFKSLHKNYHVKRHLFILGVNLAVCRTDCSIMTEVKNFCLSDYDVIGFDLDHTLARYHVKALSQLIYRTLARFLIERKAYPSQIEGKYEDSCDFFVKGLILDKGKGNFLRLSHNHVILKATHGTKCLGERDIERIYGSTRVWAPTIGLPELLCRPKSSLQPFFMFRDYFVIPVPFLIARAVDLLDEGAFTSTNKTYGSLWEDVLEGIVDMYRRDAFQKNEGVYFPAIRRDPSSYLAPYDRSIAEWLQRLRERNKKIFLLTSSHVDYANMLMSHCLGPSWRDYFDIVVTFARKPGFFTSRRQFLELDGEVETDIVANTLSRGGIYSQGNREDLELFFVKECNKTDPRIVYVGDSLVDDVVCPSVYTGWHTIGIVEEMAAEGMEGHPPDHPANIEITSNLWGSFFTCRDTRSETLLGKAIGTHARLAVPHLASLARVPLDKKLPAFSSTEGFMGYYPAIPLSCKSQS